MRFNGTDIKLMQKKLPREPPGLFAVDYLDFCNQIRTGNQENAPSFRHRGIHSGKLLISLKFYKPAVY